MPGKNNKRPVYLNLVRIRLPIGGIVSILHRVTGVLLVLALPASLLALERSLADAAGYARLADLAASPAGRVALWVVVLATAHHLFAGLRHLLLDLDIGIERARARLGAWLVLGGVAAVALAFSAMVLR